MTRKVFFVGVGAQRAGTSWMYNCLNKHPEVFMPQKEVHFFDSGYEKGTDWYSNLFETQKAVKAVGEITPDYMSKEVFLERLKRFAPEVKIIVILRHPIERAFSAFNLYKLHGKVKSNTFEEALIKDPHILTQSLYSEQLEWINARFKPEQVLVSFYDDIEIEPLNFMKKVFVFLGIDESFVPPNLTVKRNVSALPEVQNFLKIPVIQSYLLNSFLKKPFIKFKKSKAGKKLKTVILTKSEQSSKIPSLPEKYLYKVAMDIERVSELTGRDLSKWIKKLKVD
ncbi:sulfotransferase [Alteromonas sediminis]|uniref:Sulfotransferase n=1 Tax=Alteromonas sediminis TaxID=2259342 RepID=A0A3N5XXJ6_9ALTE|nr:sulfotransferase [Alteromonas sediminis]RPJ65727.1 sulfotransferase [Alteromonas sediminis]